MSLQQRAAVVRACVMVGASLALGGSQAFGQARNFIGDTLATPSYSWNVAANWNPTGVPLADEIATFNPPAFRSFYALDRAYTPSTRLYAVYLDFSAYSLQANLNSLSLDLGSSSGRATSLLQSNFVIGGSVSNGIAVRVYRNALYSLSGTGAFGTQPASVGASLDVDAGGTFSQSGGTVALAPVFGSGSSSTVVNTISGQYIMSGGTMSGDVEFSGSSATGTYTGGSVSGNVYVRNLAFVKVDLPSFAGNLVYSGGTLSIPTNTFTAAGGFAVASTYTNAATSTLNVNGAGLVIDYDYTQGAFASPGSMLNNGIVNTNTLRLGSYLYQNAAGATTTLTGSLTINGTSGVQLVNNGRLSVGSNFSITGGTFAQNGGTTTVTGSLQSTGGLVTIRAGQFSVSGSFSNDASASFTGGTTTITGNYVVGSLTAGSTTLTGATLNVLGSETINTAANFLGPASLFTQTNGTHTVSGSLTVGIDRALYSLTNGYLSAQSLLIATGSTAGSSGTFTQNGGTVSLASSLQLGLSNGATGSFIAQGGTLLVPSISAGIGGAASVQWTGSTVTLSGAIGLATAVGGLATVTASSSAITANSLTVGLAGVASFTQSGGTTTINGPVTLGSASTGAGSFFLTAPVGSLTAASETIGLSGSGAFTQSAGTHTVTGALVLASSNGSTGSYTLTGGRLNVGSLSLSAASSSAGGASNFTQTLGIVSSSGLVTVGNDAFGSAQLNINGGTFSAPTLNINRLGVVSVLGTLTVNTVNSTGSLILAAPNSIPVLNLRNLSTTTLTAPLTVTSALNLTGGALAGSGSLTLTSGATLQGFGVLNLASVTNAGSLIAKSGNLLIPDTTAFSSTGTLGNGVGSNLFIQSTSLSNTGNITVNGAGSVVFDSPIVNSLGKSVTLLGGVLGTPTLSNFGTISGFGQITGNVTNSLGGTVNIYGPTQIVGNLENRGTFNATNVQTLITGAGVNYGIIKTTKATIIFQGGLTNFGVYNSDPSDNYFTSLTVPGPGYLIGGTGDNFIISGNFTSSSTATGWNTSSATLKLNTDNSSNFHVVDYTAHRGTPFAWNTITLEPGNTAVFAGTTPRTGTPGQPLVATNFNVSGFAIIQSGLTVVTNLNLASDAAIDLTNTDMIVRNGDATTLGQIVGNWYNNGAYDNQVGIYSSFAGNTDNDEYDVYKTLAVFSNVARANIPYFTSFATVPLLSTDVIIKFAYVGDLNLDGVVDGQDYKLANEGRLFGLSGWLNGDINYDGVVDDSDLQTIARIESLNLPKLAGFPTLEGDESSQSIPEPACLAAPALATLLCGRRRRMQAGL